MIVLKDEIAVNAPPSKFVEWFSHIDEKYREWHPEHILGRYIKGTPFEEGSILYFEEYIGKPKYKFRFLVNRVEPDKRMEYKILFPYTFLNARGSFTFQKQDGGTRFIAVVSVGWGGAVGRLLDRIYWLFGGGRLKEIRRHMADEGVNMKKIMEGK